MNASFRLCSALLVLYLALGCKGGGGRGGGSRNVVVFTDAAEITFLTGAAEVVPVALLATESGVILLVDASGSIVLIDIDGAAFLFTGADEITALTGEGSALLGPLDQIFAGSQAGQIIGADDESGLMIRLELDGTPRIHSTEAQITAFTGEASARVSLPRALTNNQIIAQELVSGDVLLFGTSGFPAAFVTQEELAAAAGLPAGAAVVAGWTRGGGTGSQFARFEGTNNIVRIQINSLLDRYVEGSDLEDLFPGVGALRILDFVADTDTDALLILIGDGDRGVALAIVTAGGDLDVFASADDLEDEAGAGYDISAIGVLADGVPFAIDRGGTQVFTFAQGGLPLLLADREGIEDASDSPAPEISTGVRLGSSAVIVPEAASGHLLRVR